MTTDIQSNPWIEPQFLENQRTFPAEKLLNYRGQHIAWSWDGSKILAAAPERETLHQFLRDAGVDPLQVIYDFVYDPDVSYLG